MSGNWHHEYMRLLSEFTLNHYKQRIDILAKKLFCQSYADGILSEQDYNLNKREYDEGRYHNLARDFWDFADDSQKYYLLVTHEEAFDHLYNMSWEDYEKEK